MLAMGLFLKVKKAVFNTATVILTNLRVFLAMAAGTNSGGARIADTSGNNNVATLYSGVALSLNGTTSVVTVTGNVLTNTIMFWVKPTSITSQSMLQLTTGANIGTTAGGALTSTGLTSPTYYVNGVATSALTAGAWQMVAIVTNTQITANAVLFGKVGAVFFAGSISDVRIYSTALSAGQALAAYQTPETPFVSGLNSGNLTGWWQLDENNATLATAFDSSSATNHGVITAGTYVTAQDKIQQTAFQGCDRLMYFDGTDDRVQVAHVAALNPVTDYSIYLEFLNKQPSVIARLIGKQVLTNTYYVTFNTNGSITFSATNANTVTWTPAVLNDNRLLRLLCIHDATGLYIYEGGTLRASLTGTFTMAGNTSAVQIGAVSTAAGYYKGVILRCAFWNNVLTGGQITTLTSTSDPLALGNTPAGYWLNTGNTAADWIDRSGNANHGTVVGSPTLFRASEGITAGQDIFGRLFVQTANNWLNLLGADRAEVADSATNSITGACTVEAWIDLPYTVAARQVVFGKGILAATNLGGYAMSIESDGKAAFSIGNTTTINQVKTAAAISAATWVHIAATWDGTTGAGGMIIYVNGTQSATATATTATVTDNTNPLVIGSEQSGFAPFLGMLDDVRIYNAVLTPAQILNNFNASKSGKI
jgi:hypothetical protein